jgi:phage-related protein
MGEKTIAAIEAEYNAMAQAQNNAMVNAQNAYNTAGMSANDYMETVTSFSASLIQSLNGDTVKAAEVADRAIIDMSDNANKMGTDIGMIQNAYQGFAKQNYTMLDNLKLGYGGTKTEMQRLISDAAKLKDVQSELGITIDANSMSFGNIVNAISVMQKSMGIAGTTADEAARTIQGSISMTKAAWQNLLVGFADDSQNFELLIDNFVTSVTTATKNIVPRLAQILGGISDAIAEIIPVIAEELPALIEELLPGVIKGAGALIEGLISALPELLTALWSALGQIVSGIWDYIFVDLLGTDYDFSAMFSDLTSAAKDAWSEIQQTWNAIGRPVWDSMVRCVEMVRNAFQKKMPEMKGFASDAFGDIVSFWNDNLQPCLQAIGDFIETYIAPVFEAVFGQLIGASVEAGFQFISDLWNNTLMPVLTGITDFLTGVFTGNWDMAFGGLKGIFDGFAAYLETGWNALVTFFTTLFAPLIPWFQDAWNSIKEWASNAVESMKEKWEDFKESIAEKIASVVATVTSKFTEIKQQIESKVNDAKQKAKDAFEEIRKSILEAMTQAKTVVSEKWEEIKGMFADAVEVGKKIVDDIKSGISQAWANLTKWFNDLWDDLFGNLNANLNFNWNQDPPPGEATGLNFVPYDEFPALLHQGEAVLNSVQARAWRSGEGGSGLNQDVTNVLLMILDAIVEGNSKETVFKLNNREFGRAVRGVVNV